MVSYSTLTLCLPAALIPNGHRTVVPASTTSGSSRLSVPMPLRAKSGALGAPMHPRENLNRMVYATRADIGRLKVNVVGDAIERAGVGTVVVRIPKYVSDRDVVEAIAKADFIFGCMDGAEGRNVLNRLATCYLLPYIDVGVKLLADGSGTIDEVSTASHYLQPGFSSVGTRGVFTPDEVFADSMRRTNSEEYARRRRERATSWASTKRDRR